MNQIFQKIFNKEVGKGILLALFFLFLFFLLYKDISNGYFFAKTDIFLINSIVGLRNTEITWMILFFTYLGNWQFIIGTGLVMVFLLFYLKKIRTALFFAGSIVVGELAITSFKPFLHRSRPDLYYSMITRDGFSFPSGHSVISVVFYGFIAYLLCKNISKNWQRAMIFFIATILVIAIGFSRVYLGVHWPSDVIGGWLVGLFVLITSISFFRQQNIFTKP